MCFASITAAFLVPNDCETFSQSLSKIGNRVVHRTRTTEYTDRALKSAIAFIHPVRATAFLQLLATSLGQQLALRFEPIGLSVARQSKSAPAFGNEIGSKANGVL